MQAFSKSVLDYQKSVSLLKLELTSNPAWPFSEGAKRDFTKDTFWHVSHTLEQKLFATWLDWDEFAETVVLQSTGIGQGVELIVNSSAENGLHLYEQW